MYGKINIYVEGKFAAQTTLAKDLITARKNYADLLRIALYRVRAEYEIPKKEGV